jgi:hypothetical protein
VAAKKSTRASKAIEAIKTAEIDASHIEQALDRVKDPMLRYFLWLFIDLVTERIEQLEKFPANEADWRALLGGRQH